jgi:hypothetical protein
VTTKPDIIPDGLPDHLPEGERLIWQGKPDWKNLAFNAFHIRKVAAYFAAIIVAQGAFKYANGLPAFESVPGLLGLALAACAILAVMAYANAKTTRYTLTTKRVLMKVGIAVPVIINLPLRQIDGASFAQTGQGCGNIVFQTGGETRLAYLLLWPHAKPWHFTKPQPAFRGISDVELVAKTVSTALGGQMPASRAQSTEMNGHMVPAE